MAHNTNCVSSNSSHTYDLQLTTFKLNAHNYSEWAQAIKMSLGARNKLDLIFSDPPTPPALESESHDSTLATFADDDATECEKWVSDNLFVRSWLLNSIEPTISSSVKFLATAKEVWQALHRAYSTHATNSNLSVSVSPLPVYQLYDNIFRFHQLHNQSLADYYSAFKTMINELNHYHPLTNDLEKLRQQREEFYISKFLSGLDPNLHSICSRILAADAAIPSLNNVYAQLVQASYDNNSLRSPDAGNKGEASSSRQHIAGGIGINGGQGSGRAGRGRGRGRSRGRGCIRKCTHCGGENHTVDTCYDLHGKPWKNQNQGTYSSSTTSDTSNWKEIQESLKKGLVTEDDFVWKLPTPGSTSITKEEQQATLKYVGGVDVSYSKEDPSVACGTLVVLDLCTLQVVYHDFSHAKSHIPYLPGFLAFREAPVLLELLEKMKKNGSPFYPQLLMVDGNGILHPRGFGLASHLGVQANLPTIGIGKTLYYLDGLTESGVKQRLQAKENGGQDFTTLKGRSGRIWGVAMKSSGGSLKPIFVSIGHRVSLETAFKIVKMTCKYRVPEPIRQADLISRDYIRKHQVAVSNNATD